MASFTSPRGGSDGDPGSPPSPELTQERYEEVVRTLTSGESLESPSDLLFEGPLVHVAAQTQTGFLVVDVFESEEAFARFGDQIGPIARAAGIEEPPTAYPAHTFIVS